MACLAVTPVADMHPTLRISEIFYSLQGETRTSGLPTVFVRLTGCPLRCQYCDTAYAFNGGEVMSLDSIVCRIAEYRPRYVCVTGGEPLAQQHQLSPPRTFVCLTMDLPVGAASTWLAAPAPPAIVKATVRASSAVRNVVIEISWVKGPRRVARVRMSCLVKWA